MKKNLFSLLLACLGLSTVSLNAQNPNNALSLAGTIDYLYTSSYTTANIHSMNTFTVEMWAQKTSASNSRIISSRTSANNYFVFGIDATNRIYAEYKSPTQNVGAITYNSAIITGQWHHIAVVCSAGTFITIYLDGVALSTLSSTANSTAVDGFHFGAISANNQGFSGNIDEFKVWSSILDDCRIENNYKREVDTTSANLHMYYKFNQGIAGGNNANIIIQDSGPNNFNLTPVNMSLSGSVSNIVGSTAPLNGTGIVNHQEQSHNFTFCYGNDFTLLDGITYTATQNEVKVLNLQTMQNCSLVYTANITVNPTYHFKDTVTICWGDSVVLPTGNVVNGLTINTPFNFTDNTVLGCDSLTDFYVIVDPKINSYLYYNSATTALTGTPVAHAVSYAWYDCNADSLIANSDTLEFYPSVNGNYALVINSASCSERMACVSAYTVGIDENSIIKNISLYPNPTTSHLYLTPKVDLSSNFSWKILSLSGQVILHGNQMQVDVSGLAKGMYLIELSDKGERYTRKFLKN